MAVESQFILLFGSFGHEDDEAMLCKSTRNFFRGGVLVSKDIASIFLDGHLEAQADSKERHLALASPLGGLNHSLNSS